MNQRRPVETDILPSSADHLVVCVDDDPATLGALKRALRDEPYELLATLRPDQALEWVATRDVSIAVIDYRMAAMSGIDVLDAVRRRSPETSCVVLTGYPEGFASRLRPAQRVEELIAKPWEDDDLRRTLRLVLREREMTRSAGDPLDGIDLGGEGGGA